VHAVDIVRMIFVAKKPFTIHPSGYRYSCTGQGTQQPLEHVSGLTELLVPDCARGSFKNGAGHTGNMYPEGNEMALALEVIAFTKKNRVAKYGMPQLTFD